MIGSGMEQEKSNSRDTRADHPSMSLWSDVQQLSVENAQTKAIQLSNQLEINSIHHKACKMFELVARDRKKEI